MVIKLVFSERYKGRSLTDLKAHWGWGWWDLYIDSRLDFLYGPLTNVWMAFVALAYGVPETIVIKNHNEGKDQEIPC